MYARVIPIRHLPSGLTMFEYAIPDELTASINPGQLVLIPFKKSEIFGLVFELKEYVDAPARSIKPITACINTTPLLSGKNLQDIIYISKLYGVAPSIIAKMMLPPLKKRKIGSCDYIPFSEQHSLKFDDIVTYYTYSNQTDQLRLISSIAQGNTLILVPEIHMIDEHVAILKKIHKNIIVWHSYLSPKIQFENWCAVRNAQNSIVIGSRSSIFLPIPNLRNIIIDVEQDPGHKQWDLSPRFSVQDIAKIITKKTSVNLHLLSYSPSLSGYYAIQKNKYHAGNEFSLASLGRVTIVDMGAERHGKNFSPLSYQAEQAMLCAVRDIFIYMNRRGSATAVMCAECRRVETCTACGLALTFYKKDNTLACHYCKTSQQKQDICPACSSGTMVFRGVGVHGLKDHVHGICGDGVDIEVIDSEIIQNWPKKQGLKKNSKKRRRIFIGTDAAFPYIDWSSIETVICASIDAELFMPEYTAAEQTWHTLQKINFLTNGAGILVQTYTPGHVLFRSFAEPERFYRMDLNLRRSLLYPPYSYLVRYFYGNTNKNAAQKESKRVAESLVTNLTKHEIKAKLLGPIEMHPGYYRKKFWYTIVIKTAPEQAFETIQHINSYIPTDWRIDPNPLSTLSP